MLKDNEAQGIRLEDKREITSKIVLSNATPHHTYTKMVSPNDLPEAFNK